MYGVFFDARCSYVLRNEAPIRNTRELTRIITVTLNTLQQAYLRRIKLFSISAATEISSAWVPSTWQVNI